MSLFASIDVGSNTLRLLIGRFVGNRLAVVFTDRKITRLGSVLDQTGILQPGPVEASLQALRGFSSVMNRYQVRHVRAVATSALREAQNSDLFIKRVQKETGIQIMVISGEREAQLTLKGVLHAFSPEGAVLSPRAKPRGKAEKPRLRSLFIMDIGGGSTEWIVHLGGDRNVTGSLPSGVIKLAQKCISGDPVSKADIQRLNHEIAPVLTNLETHGKHLITGSTLFVGTGGTFTTIASVDRRLDSYSREQVHLHHVSLSRLKKMQRTFLQLDLEERKKIRGLEPDRADLIIPGVQFTMKVMELFHFRKLIISDSGLLEGVILEMKGKLEESLSEAGKS